MGKGERRKGHDFERNVANVFRTSRLDAKRGLGQARGGGEVADVMVKLPFSGPACHVEGLWVECKRGARTNIKRALKQATDALEDSVSSGPEYAGYIPTAVTKDDYGISMVTMHLYDFLSILGVMRSELPDLQGCEEKEWDESNK